LSDVDAWIPSECKSAGAKRLTVGDVLTSEQGVAVGLRLHVWRPAALTIDKPITKKKKITCMPILHDALKALYEDGTLKNEKGELLGPTAWEDAHEAALLDEMIKRLRSWTASAGRSTQQARYFPLEVDKKPPYEVVMVKQDDGKMGPKLLDQIGIPRGSKQDEYAPKTRRNTFDLVP